MDNVTHSLIGALLGEASRAEASRRHGGESRGFRTLALLSSILSNNMPDFDFVYRRVTGGKIGYLLHHRGHTHTLPGALGLGVLTFVLVLGFAKLRRFSVSSFERRVLAGLSLGGPFIHVALDYTNNYGVHPFWPLDDAWYYGDSVFIVEPSLWAVALPPLALLSTSFIGRALAGVLFVAGLWVGGSTGALSIAQELTLAGLAALMTLVTAQFRPERRASFGLAAWVGVTALFFAEGHLARARAVEASAIEFPTTHMVDLVTTPRPADPLCWSALMLGKDGDSYVARRATISTAPWRRSCVSFDGSTSTAPLDRLTIARGDVRFEREFRSPVSEFRRLSDRSCTARAFFRYARAPFWSSDHGATVVGDLRFDRSPALEFTEFQLPEPDDVCPRNVPPWKPPRADLLE